MMHTIRYWSSYRRLGTVSPGVTYFRTREGFSAVEGLRQVQLLNTWSQAVDFKAGSTERALCSRWDAVLLSTPVWIALFFLSVIRTFILKSFLLFIFPPRTHYWFEHENNSWQNGQQSGKEGIVHFDNATLHVSVWTRYPDNIFVFLKFSFVFECVKWRENTWDRLSKLSDSCFTETEH